jgi:hypothetical protein
MANKAANKAAKPSPGNSPGKRNKLLHRFYEPLVLLYVLDPTQGEHDNNGRGRLPLEDLTAKDLRRRFLDCLAYVCDSEKGGDTITAIGVAASPLRYFVAGNKSPGQKVKEFLDGILGLLGRAFGLGRQEGQLMEDRLLEVCVDFSEKRIRTYWRFLRDDLRECGRKLDTTTRENGKIPTVY